MLFKHRPCNCLLAVNIFRQPHNPKVGGSNPPPQPTFFDHLHPIANPQAETDSPLLSPLDFQCFLKEAALNSLDGFAYSAFAELRGLIFPVRSGSNACYTALLPDQRAYRISFESARKIPWRQTVDDPYAAR